MARTSSYCEVLSETRSTHVSSAHSQMKASSSSAKCSKRAASSRIRSLIARNMTSFRARRASRDTMRRSSHAERVSLHSVDALARGDGAGELELDERLGDLGRRAAVPTDELVGRGGQEIEERVDSG